jgi:hypothetical protein
VQGVAADEIQGVIDLRNRSFKGRPTIAGVVQEAGYALGMILEDQFRRIAIGYFDAIRFDGVDVLGEKGGSQIDEES